MVGLVFGMAVVAFIVVKYQDSFRFFLGVKTYGVDGREVTS